MIGHCTGSWSPEQRTLLAAVKAVRSIKPRRSFYARTELSMAIVFLGVEHGWPISDAKWRALPSLKQLGSKLTPAQQLQSGCEALWSAATAKAYVRATDQQRALMLANMSPTDAVRANKGRRGYSRANLSTIKAEMDTRVVNQFSIKPVSGRALIKHSTRVKQAQELADWVAAESMRHDVVPTFVTANLTTKVLNQNSGKKTIDRVEMIIQRFDPTARLEGVAEVGPKTGSVHLHLILFTKLSRSEVIKAIKRMRCTDSDCRAVAIKPISNLFGAASYCTKSYLGDEGRAIMRRPKLDTLAAKSAKPAAENTEKKESGPAFCRPSGHDKPIADLHVCSKRKVASEDLKAKTSPSTQDQTKTNAGSRNPPPPIAVTKYEISPVALETSSRSTPSFSVLDRIVETDNRPATSSSLSTSNFIFSPPSKTQRLQMRNQYAQSVSADLWRRNSPLFHTCLDSIKAHSTNNKNKGIEK